MVETRAAGTPAFCRRSSTSVADRARVTAASVSCSATRCSTRRGLSTKRGSRASSGTPRAAVVFTKSASEAAAIITQPSETGNAS